MNANHLENKFGFSSAIKVDYSAQSAQEKLARWQQNWCFPVVISGLDVR